MQTMCLIVEVNLKTYTDYDELKNPINAVFLVNQIGIQQRHCGVDTLQLLMVGHL